MMMYAVMLKLLGVWYEHAFFSTLADAESQVERIRNDGKVPAGAYRIQAVKIHGVSHVEAPVIDPQVCLARG